VEIDIENDPESSVAAQGDQQSGQGEDTVMHGGPHSPRARDLTSQCKVLGIRTRSNYDDCSES